MDRIETFINNFKVTHKEALEDVFSNGYCYHFARMLQSIFDGVILYSQIDAHMVLANDEAVGYVYDINGKHRIEDISNDYDALRFIKVDDPLLYERIVRDCIKKENNMF